MPTTAARFEPRPLHQATNHGHAEGLLRDNLLAHMTLLERTPATQTVTSHAVETAASTEVATTPAHGLPERIRRLIDLQGSATAIAERCGFSAGAVRSWRDGHSDISRERCVTMARVLGISLLWLVAGEGPMRVGREDANRPPAISATPAGDQHGVPDIPRAASLDSKLLAAALRLLQSYIGLVGGSLDPATRADLLAELYGILGRAQDSGHVDRLVVFHNTLCDQLRRHRALIS